MSNARNISKADSRFVNATGDTISGDFGVVNAKVAFGGSAAFPTATTDPYIGRGPNGYLEIGARQTAHNAAYISMKTANQEGLRIDSNGNVTTPSQVAFVAYNAPTSYVNNATVVWTSTALNRQNGYNTSTGRFTAPTSGLYQFFASGRIEIGQPITTYHRFVFEHNGFEVRSSQSRLTSRYNTANYSNVSNDQLIGMEAGDYVRVEFQSSTGSFNNNSLNEHVFYGYLVG